MTRSRQFRRVSTDHQTTAKQISDLDDWDARHGYDAGDPYVIEASAFHSRHLPLLVRAIEDMEAGEYEVLTFWAADRMWRGESLAQVLTLVERIHAAGGRVEFVKDSHLNVAGDSAMPAWVRNMLFAQAFGVANAESQRKRERTLMDIAHHQKTGSIHGKPSWGFEVVGPKDAKVLVPTIEGRRWVPQMYAWALNGDGCVKIAKKLTEAGVGGGKKWSEGVVNHLLRNPVYYGNRRNGGRLETEPLVPFSVWQEVVAAVESRRRGGRSSTKWPAPLLKPVCAACWGVEREGSRNGVSIAYLNRYPDGYAVYKCCGSGPQRKGCGAKLIPADELDALVVNWFSRSAQPHMTRTFIPGRDVAAELRDLNWQVQEAMSQGDYALVSTLSQKAQEASQTEGTRGRWMTEMSGITKGDHFKALDRDAKRAYLAEMTILAERAEDGKVRAGEYVLAEDGDGQYGTVQPWG